MALTDKLTAIANAIRAKTGKTDAMTLDGMASEIEAIETGGGGDLDGFIEGTMTELTSGAGTVRQYATNKNGGITSANFPNASSIGDYAFSECPKLATVNFPKVISIGRYVFQNCAELTTANFPSATSIGGSAFYGTGFTTVNFPNATSIGGSAFFSCIKLTTVDFPNATSIGGAAFRCSYKLTSLILRSETLCTLAGTNAFDTCYHYHGTVNSYHNPDGLKDGYIYVPSALIEDYKVETNWSTFATQFRALEDYTVDGTITGELDPEKI